MAQTVATVRGTGSGSSSGSATLFTQSGGNATRVIFNQFSAYSPDYTYRTSLSFTMNHVVSNGSTNTIGWFQTSGSGGSTSFQLLPNPNSTGPMETVPIYVNGYFYNINVNGGIVGSAGNYTGNNSSITIGVPTYGSSNSAVYSYAPQNFWIGPGDSVAIRWSWYLISDTYYYPTFNYAYHFTTITES